MSPRASTARLVELQQGQRALRPWLIGGLSLLLIAGASTFAHRSHRNIASAEGADPPGVIRIHQSDVRGTERSTGAMRIRCRFCAGGGKTWHWAEFYQHGHLVNRFKDGVTTCPACDGSGVISTADLRDMVRIVPDAQATDYNEGRLVR